MTTLTQLTSSQAAKEVTANENFSAVSPAGALGRRAAAHTGLTWGYYGGSLWVNGAFVDEADGTILLTDDDVNYIEYDLETEALTKNIVGFTDGAIPLYEVTAASGAITVETDRRVVLNAPTPYTDQQVIAYAATIASDAMAGEVVLVGALTAAITVDPPTNPYDGAKQTYVFVQDGTGSFGITWDSVFSKAADPTAGTANQKAATSFVYDGSEWVQIGGALVWNT